MNKLFYILLSFVLLSCTPEKRLQRLLKKFPHLIHSTDTTIKDTTILASFHYDTTVNAQFFRDTIYIKQNNLQTKIFYNYKTDSLYISNYKQADTIYKTITVPGKTITIKESENNGLKYLYVLALIILLMIGFFKAIRRPTNERD